MKKVYFSIILLLVSATTFAQENIESLLKQLCEDPVFAKQLSITEPSELQAFYKDNNFQPIWHENKAFQDWADQPLPDAARRLRDRPAIIGADASIIN